MEALAHARRSGGERFNERNIDAHLPSAPPMMLEDPVMDWQQGQSRNMAQQASTVTLTPSVVSTVTLVPVYIGAFKLQTFITVLGI